MPTLEWIGKDKVISHHLDVPYHVLDRKYSFNENGKSEEDNDSENMIIHGDNLIALKSLLPKYEGKIKKWLGEVVGKEGEDLSRHDKWLCMMYPRLKLLQKLLSEDEAIFISIDDMEVANLIEICNEIFGEQNHIATFVWQKRYSPDTRRAISDAHEFILCYATNPERFKETRNLLPLGEAQSKQFSNPDHDSRGPWKSDNFTAPGYRPNQMYEITLPSGRVVTPPEGRCWRVTKEGFEKLAADNRMIYGNNGDGAPAVKRFLSEMPGMVPWTWWNYEEVGHSQEGNKQLAAILGKAVFDYPKPTRLIERIIRIATDKDSIVLDSFAGSGTTAHAVLNMNKQDGGHRKFILIEMMDYADSITAERVRRVIRGYGEAKKTVEGTGGSFSYYELGEPLLIDGRLNTNIPEETIRSYIWYMETKKEYQKVNGSNHYYLGHSSGTDFYFYYDKDKQTVLNHAFLSTIKKKADSYVIYADRCLINEKDLLRFGITFKKIPRDVPVL